MLNLLLRRCAYVLAVVSRMSLLELSKNCSQTGFHTSLTFPKIIDLRDMFLIKLPKVTLEKSPHIDMFLFVYGVNFLCVQKV